MVSSFYRFIRSHGIYSDTSPSQISQEAFDKVTQENAQLSRRVDELVAQVSVLIKQTQRSGRETAPQVHPPTSPLTNITADNTHQPAPTPPVPSLPLEQVQAIIDKVAAAVLSAIDSSRKRQPTRTTEVLKSSTSRSNAMLDTSFDLTLILCIMISSNYCDIQPNIDDFNTLHDHSHSYPYDPSSQSLSQTLNANSCIGTPLPKDKPNHIFHLLCGNPNGFTIGPHRGDFICGKTPVLSLLDLLLSGDPQLFLLSWYLS